jgi:RNA polymerase sigma-70 factor, ECF subfamily
MSDSPQQITQLLVAWSNGDASALDKLVPLADAELHRIALRFLASERAGHSLQATALVNEAYVRLIDWKGVTWQSRAHFFAVAAKLMRRILVDHAKKRLRKKRRGDAIRISVEGADPAAPQPGLDVIALDEALDRLARFDERKSRIVEARFFGGLSEDETSVVMQLPLRTIQREWSLARAWLFRELSGPGA